MRELGRAIKFLSLEIDRNEDGITLSQQAYSKMILRCFDIHKANGVSTPIDQNIRLYEYKADEGYADTAHYQWIV
jgi:hypothetical protein